MLCIMRGRWENEIENLTKKRKKIVSLRSKK